MHGGRPSDYHFTRPEWMNRGACFTPDGVLTPLFYVKDADQSRRVIARYCESCPVRAECLEYALNGTSSAVDHGIWGGTTARERRRIRQQRARQSA